MFTRLSRCAGLVLAAMLLVALPALAQDVGIVEKKVFAMPSYATVGGKTAEIFELEGDRGHLEGLLSIAKAAEPIRKFLAE
jgi:hypothetical protein